MVAHTACECKSYDETIRIISARKADLERNENVMTENLCEGIFPLSP